MWDLPQICKRIVDNWVTIAALLTILCHGYLKTMWSPPADILRTGQNFLKFSRAVHTRSQIFEHFVTLFGTFSSSKMGCPWSGGKLDSTWLALLTWSLAKTFAASRSSEWSLTIQYYIYIQMVCLGHMHWWSLLSSHRSSLVYWHMLLDRDILLHSAKSSSVLIPLPKVDEFQEKKLQNGEVISYKQML